MNEAQNTFRALKDLPPMVTSFLCRFGWHGWEQWEVPRKSSGSIYIRQGRYCAHCRIYEERKFTEV